MKTRILLPILFILIGSSLVIGQDVSQDILLLKKNKVKSCIANTNFVYEYIYSDSIIIENISDYDQFKNRYYLNEMNLIDSVLHGSYYDDTLHIFKEYNYYNSKNQLIKKVFPPSSPGSSNSNRSFYYNQLGNLDSVYIVHNVRDYFSEKMERDSGYIYFTYDDKKRLKLKKCTSQYGGFEEVHYQYDNDGRIKSEIWDHGQNTGGVKYNPEDRLFFEFINFYHPTGYREKQIETQYMIKPDGTKIKDSVRINYYHKNGLLDKVEEENYNTEFSHLKKYNFRYEYKFYDK